jgi:acetyl esterase/lipase
MKPQKSAGRFQITFLVIVLLSVLFSECSFAQIRKKKNIPYLDKNDPSYSSSKTNLDIYFRKRAKENKGVFVFFHGGSWRSGDKKTYWFFARKMARKGFVTAVVNYRYSPEVKYEKMAEDCAHAVSWISDHIGEFRGDPARISVAGHSAGGHLAALITYGNTFAIIGKPNPVRSVILIDAFGLDMYQYFKDYHNDYAKSLYATFTSQPEEWKKASPMYFIDAKAKTPALILSGSKTYEAIAESSQQFHDKLTANDIHCDYKIVKGKKHIAMITQFVAPWNKNYRRMTEFMKQN